MASSVVSDPMRLARRAPDWKRCARGYVSLHGILRAVDDLKLWAPEVALV